MCPVRSWFLKRTLADSTMQDASTLLEKYKKYSFAKGLIPFCGAVRTVGGPHARVYAHKEGRQRWVVSIMDHGEL